MNDELRLFRFVPMRQPAFALILGARFSILGLSLVFSVALCLCGSFLLTGCESRSTPSRTLVIISPHREEIRDEVERGFNDWLAGHSGATYERVQIEWRDIGGGTSQIMRYLDAQFKATPDGVGIDLIFGGGTDIYLDLKARKQLQPVSLPGPLLRKLPTNLHGVEIRDPDGTWHGVMLTTLGVLVNHEVLQRLGHAHWFPPKRWQDLGDARLLGWISAGDPRMSGSVHLLYEWLLQVYGWEDGMRLLMRLGANARGFNRFSDGVSRDVLFGKSAAAGSLDTFGFTAVAREQRLGDLGRQGEHARDPLSFVLIPGETILNPDSIGVLKGAPQRALAERFVEYTLSEDGGQQLGMLRPSTDADVRRQFPGCPTRYALCRLSVMEALYDVERYPFEARSVMVDPFDERQVGRMAKRYDNRLADSRRRALDDLFGAWIVDTHGELHAAWRRLQSVAGAKRSELENRLFAPPLPEKDLFELRGVLADPRQRARILTQWQESARQRYREVVQAVD